MYCLNNVDAKTGQNFKQSPYQRQSFFQQFLKKGTLPKLGKKINLTAKLGEINNIEHNKGSKKIDLTAKLGEINDIEHNKGSKIYERRSDKRVLRAF